ncbi:MAG: GAF and ANTAR domain-containing protein [Actinomycetota bacterium]|jgi:GAF domain-containing protein|nr:GAF and ANTAR domain-containing protein [Actinomycetota bacterium]
MTRFGRTFLDDYDVGEVLHELSETVVDVLDVDGAGVSIGDADRLVFVTATDERSMQLEWRQSQSQDGPCTDAWRTRRPVLVEDITAVESWPVYRPGAIDVGMRAVASLPMTAGRETIGAVDAYSATVRRWDEATVFAGQVLADMATLYAVHARQSQDATTLAAALQTALDARMVVEQATGMIAQYDGSDVDAALVQWRSFARASQQPLYGVARRIVNGTLRL